MDNVPVFDWKATVSVNGPKATDLDFPRLSQDAPFRAKDLFECFCGSFDDTLAMCRDKRFRVSGIASKIGLDIHGKPSIELSDRVGGPCHTLFVFAEEDDYKTVSPGDTITCEGNYLGVTNDFGVVMKRSILL